MKTADYVLNKDGHKIMDTVAHITLFDTHPFYQQSFVKAMSFLVKTGKATQADFDFMIEMKKKRGRFSSEPLDQIKHYTALELRYLASGITGLREVLHGIKLDCAPDMKPIHISNWYGPGAVAGAVLKNLDIIKNHYGDDIRAVDPSPVQQMAAHHAFSAGNIQLMKVGHAPGLRTAFDGYSQRLSTRHRRNCPLWRADDGIKLMNGIRYKTLAELKAIIEASSMVSQCSISIINFPYMNISTATFGSEFISRGTRSFTARARGPSFIRGAVKAGICAMMRSPLSNGLNDSRPRLNGVMMERL